MNPDQLRDYEEGYIGQGLDLDALDALHFQYVRPAGRGLGDCNECEEAWPCCIRQLVAVARAAQKISDRRTLDSDGFWVSQKEMRALDAALEDAGL
jgi:hypothetical protein